MVSDSFFKLTQNATDIRFHEILVHRFHSGFDYQPEKREAHT